MRHVADITFRIFYKSEEMIENMNLKNINNVIIKRKYFLSVSENEKHGTNITHK